jgi:hypothetical protein
MPRWKRVSRCTGDTGSERFVAHHYCDMSVYADEVQRNYFPLSMAVIANIAVG